MKTIIFSILSVIFPLLAIALLAAGLAQDAAAQTPQATPTRSARELSCAEILAKFRRQNEMTPEQFSKEYPPWTRDEAEELRTCMKRLPHKQPSGESTPSPGFEPGSGVRLSPPPPPPPPDSDASPAVNPPFGPFSSFAGAEGTACPTVPNGFTQPPSAAADVSVSFNVELTNAGLWIFNKTGVAQCTGQTATNPCETLNTFWCVNGGNSFQGCGTTDILLTDTQIAFDPYNHRWIATTLDTSMAHPANTALLFAYTTTSLPSDTPGNWQRLSIEPAPCAIPPNYGQFADEPILGYGNTWIAVDTRCKGTSPKTGEIVDLADDLTLIHQADIATEQLKPIRQSLTALGNFAWRPSRDVSASSFANLYLAASMVPSGASPFVQTATVAADGTLSGPSNLPSFGDPGAYQLARPNCTSAGGCSIELGDAEIKQVILQLNPADGTHHLMTAFSEDATSLNPDRGESLWDVLDIETGRVHRISLAGNFSEVSSFATIAADPDLDIYLTSTNIAQTSGASPYGVWDYLYLAGSLHGVGQDAFQRSSGDYTGVLSCTKIDEQRWGDYMSTIWDPNAISTPSGEHDAFWTVQEFTNGGADQSTQWVEFSDPVPYFVGNSIAESECSPNANCSVTITAPSGVQPGDVLIASLDMFNTSGVPQLPTGWSVLAASNQSGAQQISSTDSCGLSLVSWLVAHVYTSGESGSYTFTHFSPVFNSCVGQSFPELRAYLVSYRLAGQDLTKYTAYGFTQNSDSTSFSVGPVSPTAEGTLLTIFSGPRLEDESTEDTEVNFTAPTGAPTLKAETPLTGTPGLLTADVTVSPSGASFGPYSTTDNAGCDGIAGCLWYGWQVALPEVNP